jgi:hypothetical protein
MNQLQANIFAQDTFMGICKSSGTKVLPGIVQPDIINPPRYSPDARHYSYTL